MREMAYEEVFSMKLLLLQLCFFLALVPGNLGEPHPSCQIWKKMAHNLSNQPRKQMSCFSNDTDTCTSLRCTGTYKYTSWLLPSSNGIEVDYCFGMRLNHCQHPVSMDIYLIVPQADNAPRNISYQRRISHDTLLQIPGFSFNVKNLGKVDVFLHFHMVRNATLNDTVDFAITVKVKVTSDSVLGNFVMWPKKMQKQIVPMEQIPVPPCTNGTHTTPVAMTDLGGCHPPTWHPPTLPPGISTTTRNPLVTTTALPKSNTYDKACDENGDRCGDREVCNMDMKKCRCGPDFVYNSEQGTCVGQNHIGQHCLDLNDCFIGETCLLGTCACKPNYVFMQDRLMCQLKNDEPDVTTPPNIVPRPHVTPQPQVVAAKSSNKTAIIAGGIVGGVVFIVLVTLVGFFLVRRMRRPYEHEMLLSDDNDGIM